MVELSELKSALEHAPSERPARDTVLPDAMGSVGQKQGALPAAERAPKRDAFGRSYGTGRRKEAIARVWIRAGSGKIVVNGKPLMQYFARPFYQTLLQRPFALVKSLGHFDVMCTVKGGGLSGQADAVRLGVARALDQFDPKAFHVLLSSTGQLTRDPRVVERKKYGQPKARRQWQYSKR